MNHAVDSTSAASFLLDRLCDGVPPRVAIILGSGLGGLATKIDRPRQMPYESVPGFVRSTAGGHQGQLIYGELESVPVIAMAGRFHRYEGWSNDETAFPVFVLQALGADHLIVSNAAGALNPKLRVGDLMVIQDHLNWIGGPFASLAPLREQELPSPESSSPERLGTGRRTMLYDKALCTLAKEAALKNGFVMTEGTYLATLGPTYETRSEYRMMRRVGADVVGMSTVPEVLAAGALGMKVLGLSMVSNVADPDRPIIADHSEVLAAGKSAAARMEGVVRGVVGSLVADRGPGV